MIHLFICLGMSSNAPVWQVFHLVLVRILFLRQTANLHSMPLIEGKCTVSRMTRESDRSADEHLLELLQFMYDRSPRCRSFLMSDRLFGLSCCVLMAYDVWQRIWPEPLNIFGQRFWIFCVEDGSFVCRADRPDFHNEIKTMIG